MGAEFFSISTAQTARFRKRLLRWYDAARRDLPWRRTRDPYAIWIAEIMLQQTRVAAVIPYYERFLKRFPDVKALAQAPEQDLLACWSGLGYYSRARNLQKAARQIVALGGGFPQNYEAIRELAGVGDYTAAAVASICFGLPHAVVDGNVLRVLSRFTAESGDIGSMATRKRLRDVAQTLLDPKNPARFNQAIMELGATMCLPRQPQCLLCPVSEDCEARRRHLQHELPVKLRRTMPVAIDRTLLVIEKDEKLLLWQRLPGSGRLAGFWELPDTEQLPGARVGKPRGVFRHSITHHNYTISVAPATIGRVPEGFQWVLKSRLGEIPLSTTARKALSC